MEKVNRNSEYVKFKIKKAKEYLESRGYEVLVVSFNGSRHGGFIKAAALIAKADYEAMTKRYRLSSTRAIMYCSQYVINVETGEWIKQRCDLPETLAEKVLYEQK